MTVASAIREASCHSDDCRGSTPLPLCSKMTNTSGTTWISADYGLEFAYAGARAGARRLRDHLNRCTIAIALDGKIVWPGSVGSCGNAGRGLIPQHIPRATHDSAEPDRSETPSQASRQTSEAGRGNGLTDCDRLMVIAVEIDPLSTPLIGVFTLKMESRAIPC